MSYYLILMYAGAAMWGVPTPYPDAAQCEAAGRGYTESIRGRFHCLPAPIMTGESVNRQFKRDAYPMMKCIAEATGGAGPSGGTRVVCE